MLRIRIPACSSANVLVSRRIRTTRNRNNYRCFSSKEASEKLLKHYMEEYAAVRFWHMGKSRGEDVNLVLGASAQRLEIDVRLHVVNVIPIIGAAPDMPKKDLVKLFAYYDEKRGGAGMNTNSATSSSSSSRDERHTLAYMEDVTLSSREGIRIHMPECANTEDHIVSHDDFVKNILPHRDAIFKTYQMCRVKVRHAVMDVIEVLLNESFIFEHNFLNSDHPEYAQEWNELDGPKANAVVLMEKFGIKQGELQAYFQMKDDACKAEQEAKKAASSKDRWRKHAKR